MDQIFDSFTDRDLSVIKDRVGKSTEITGTVLTVIFIHSAAVMAIVNEVLRSAMRTAADLDRVDHFDLFL